MQEFEHLKELVESADNDIAKADGGNQAASVRARKLMQEVKKAAQEVRNKLLELRQAKP